MNSDEKLSELEKPNRRLLEQAELLQQRLGRLESVTDALARSAFWFLALLLAVGVLLSMYPLALSYAQRVYNPTKIPDEYQRVISYLEKQGKDTRVMWLPLFGAGHSYDWAGEKRIGPFEVWSSNPSLNDYFVVPGSYGYWLERELYQKGFVQVSLSIREEVIKQSPASRLFIPYNARYMVLDQSITGYDFGDRFDSDTSLELVLQEKRLKVYRIKEGHDLIWPASRAVKAQSYYDELCLYQRLNWDAINKITFLNGDVTITGQNRPVWIKRYQQELVYNEGFERHMVNGLIPGWLPAQLDGNYQASYDVKVKAEGKRSLKVVNRSSESVGLGWVSGTEIPATPGTMYSVETRLRYHNAVWTNIALEGFEEAGQRWLLLAQCPSIMTGDSGWKTWNCSLVLPEGYSKIRPSLGAGWVQDRAKGPAVSWFDGISISKVDDSLFRDVADAAPPPQVTFEKLSTEKYLVHVKNAAGPFILVFGEAYDTLWEAKTRSGKTIDSVLLYGCINGFPVDETGDFDVTIEYPPQSWFQQGLVISISAVLLCLLYLVFGPLVARSAAVEKAAAIRQRSGGRIRSGISRFRSILEEPPEGARRFRPVRWLRNSGLSVKYRLSKRVSSTTSRRLKPRRTRTFSSWVRACIEEPPGPPRRMHPVKRFTSWVRKARGLLSALWSTIFEETRDSDAD